MSEPMATAAHQHVCALLGEALRLLDAEDQLLAAIHVSQAMEYLGCRISDPEATGVARA
ncbi:MULTISPECIES: hypothetical protein [unclassified Sphingomonas]|uniref:hypothetical protein n=1 Tax=unclassified Sphingomonas TaxID=196159 RepID=UPI002269E9AF|nr:MULTISPECIES: hypothetical protein [unclassified Sphingomonas]